MRLADVPADQLDGESVLLQHYRRAVYCLAKATLIERYRDTTRPATAPPRRRPEPRATNCAAMRAGRSATSLAAARDRGAHLMQATYRIRRLPQDRVIDGRHVAARFSSAPHRRTLLARNRLCSGPRTAVVMVPGADARVSWRH
ncbi:head completion/stabilization protein [Pseudomonas citronellolis]|uniref:head completion/stabilization protein n=1 Tax=Pseudomonas citronellolis TaxID=53408 RepID=UPI0022A97E18|nr:head completion/stabilization protein [Pseudomonas humi]